MGDKRQEEIPLSEEAAAVLAELGAGGEPSHERAGRRAQPVGPLLYVLLRAIRPGQSVELGPGTRVATLWLALATETVGGALHVLTGDEEDVTLRQTLQRAGTGDEVHLAHGDPLSHLQQLDGPFDLVYLHLDGLEPGAALSLLQGKLSTRALLVAEGRNEAACQAVEAELARDARWRSVRVGGGSLLLASRLEHPAQYDENPLERLQAILLNGIQPGILALGQNVVFDGTIKPPRTRINFSGTGGEIGAGELLLTYPEDLQRYVPLPGAVALVLGDLKEPIRAPHVRLPLEEQAATLVIA